MNGELLPAWQRSWHEIWIPLSKSAIAPDDIFVELVRSIAVVPQQPMAPPLPSEDAYDADGILTEPAALQAVVAYTAAMLQFESYRDDYETALSGASGVAAKPFFKKLHREVNSETVAIEFLEMAWSSLVGYENDRLSSRYRELVSNFLTKFNIRYELSKPFRLHATVPGVFTKLFSEVKRISKADPHLNNLLLEFEEAFSDLRLDRSQSRIKTCLQKQFNLLEALGQRCPSVTETTLGAICNQLDWPHATIRDVGKRLYGFRSDYPGVGHGGNAQGVLRQLEMKDFVGLSMMLASFMPYVTHNLDCNHCYSAA